MGAAKKLIDKKVLRDLIPINALSAVHIQEISKKTVIDELRNGKYVFSIGDRDYQTVYLLQGQIELLDADRNVVETLSAGTESTRHPLAHKQPRQLSARAVGQVTVARVDSSLLDVLLTWDESSGYDVVEIDAHDDDDWMTRMLQSQAFLQLPPANIHQLLMRLEAVNARAGDVIVRQGDDGDYFYIVKSGRLAVTRKASVRSKEVLLAELGEGACFGEEALVSGTKRNASVMMVTDGSLMRLSKQDFNELLCAPLVHEADFEGAQKLVAKGAKWLDVRLPGEFDNQAIKGSTNLPLSALRDQSEELDTGTDYIVCCDTGRRSAAGAFVLSQRGFSVYTLKNGLMDVPEDELTRANSHTRSTPVETKDAEIIPFEADAKVDADAKSRSGSGEIPPAEVDTVLIDRLAASEAEKLALEQQLSELEEKIGKAESQTRDALGKHQEALSELQAVKAEADAARNKLQADEQALQQRSDLADQEKAALQTEFDALKSDFEAAQRRYGSIDNEKKALEEELHRVQQTLTQIQESADGRDDALRGELEQMVERLESERQAHEKYKQDLEAELSRVREDYHQLGQRTSAVAGERDATAREVEALQGQVSGLQEQLENSQADSEDNVSQLSQLQDQLQQAEQQRQVVEDEHAAALDELRQQLDKANSELGGERDELAGRVTELQQALEEQQRQTEEQRSERDSLAAKLEQGQQQVAEAGQLAGEQLEQLKGEHAGEVSALNEQLAALQLQLSKAEEDTRSLEERLEARRCESEQTGSEYQQQLEQVRTEHAAEKDELGRNLETVRQELEVQTAAHDDVQQQLEKVQGELAEVGENARSFEEQLEKQRAEGAQSDNELKQEVDTANSKNTELEEALAVESKAREQLEQRKAELEAQISALSKEHEADVASTREAMSRAQTETDNVKREQSRLMESVRKLERDLERERHDHETEVHRLHKELKEAAGGSGDGLAAELEALQEKIREDVKERDDLEVKLGERSTQFEAVQAEAEHLALQLEQARDSARQAEQQLIEANQSANQEMAVRMEAEEKAQQALRDELASTIAERNKAQESLTVQQQELAELHQAVSVAQESMSEREQLLESASQAREEALQAREEIQQEIDQLRAEAEVTRGLVDMAAPTDEALRNELEQAKKNVDVAVRLRTQAEEKAADLEYENLRLQEALAAAGSGESAEMAQGHIPSLDADDPHAAALLSSDYAAADRQVSAEATLLIEDDEVESSNTVAFATPAASASGGGWKGLLGGIVLGAAIAGGGAWWVLSQQNTIAPRKALVDETITQPAAVKATAEPAEKAIEVARPEVGKVPDNLPSFSKGSSSVSRQAQVDEAKRGAEKKAAAAQSVEVTESRFQIPKAPPESHAVLSGQSDVGEGTVEEDVADSANVEEAIKPKSQPVRTFSEALSVGGRAPRMAEFQADSFSMGSGLSSPHFDERPQRSVEIRRFAISQREITFNEYDRFARETGRRLPADAGWGRGERPVINVSWKDARAYTQWLSGQTGSHYRLPTEAEWEFAARAGSKTRFWWGNEVGQGQANCFDCGSQWSGQKTAPVGSFAASPYGVHDMAGNVMEWVEDCYQKSYRQAPADGSAVSLSGCSEYVVRGGSYTSPADSVRSANRDSKEAAIRLDNLGFRVVKEY